MTGRTVFRLDTADDRDRARELVGVMLRGTRVTFTLPPDDGGANPWPGVSQAPAGPRPERNQTAISGSRKTSTGRRSNASRTVRPERTRNFITNSRVPWREMAMEGSSLRLCALATRLVRMV